MTDADIIELAKSLPFSISTVRDMVNDFEYVFGREPSENDRCLISPASLAAAAQIKRQDDREKIKAIAEILGIES